jgi:hypothetical protein
VEGGEITGIAKLEDVVAWENEHGAIFCEDFAPENTDKLRPIPEEQYPAYEYAITCDQCRRRVQ